MRKLMTCIVSVACAGAIGAAAARANSAWETVDKKVKQQVCQVNVGLKLQLKNGPWLYISDISPTLHLPVFSPSQADLGFRVVGTGSAFPVKVANGTTLLLTSKHVVQSADDLARECERFYAAIRLRAVQTANGRPVDQRYKQLLDIVTLSTKKNLSADERNQYQDTVDEIWNAYETVLSVSADPKRELFQKYFEQAGVQRSIQMFVHRPGSASQPSLAATRVKEGHHDLDLALLSVKGAQIGTMNCETKPANEGQEIQVAGYPQASQQIEGASAAKTYAPTFTNGRVTRVTPDMVQVDAPIAKGDSGGPVINEQGRVLGVTAVRAVSQDGTEMPRFAGAIPISAVRTFAPELFAQKH